MAKIKFRSGEEIDGEQLLGIKEDELKAGLNAGKEASNKVTELETKVTSGFDEIKAALAKLTRPPDNSGAGAGSNGGGAGNDDDDTTDVGTKLAIQATKLGLENKIDSIKTRLRERTDSDGTNYMFPHWDSLIGDMEKLTEKDSLTAKSSEAYWENAYHICFSKRFKELQDKKGRSRFSSEPTHVSGSNLTQDGKPKPSEIDIKQAANMGIPIEKYMETKQQLRFVN